MIISIVNNTNSFLDFTLKIEVVDTNQTHQGENLYIVQITNYPTNSEAKYYINQEFLNTTYLMFFYGIYSLGYIYIEDGRIQCKYKYCFPPSSKYKASFILRIHISYINIRTNDLKIYCSTDTAQNSLLQPYIYFKTFPIF